MLPYELAKRVNEYCPFLADLFKSPEWQEPETSLRAAFVALFRRLAGVLEKYTHVE